VRKRERGALALQLARDDALVFGDIEGQHRNPEHVSRQFARDVGRCREALGGEVPVCRPDRGRAMTASISSAPRGLRSGNHTPLTCEDVVSEGGLEPGNR